ncbi:AMP-binding protein [Rhodocaloribacter litoris]|uniref:AMP-binding protein n=1 Tax=Rhodocaloribacter litoris TaxID=2558931 RepID=UPI001E2FF188|nr:AMP-binding protein [Rhodocaloribacter litoris]
MPEHTHDTFPFGQAIAWEPNPQWIAESNLKRFMDRHGIATYDELMRRSVEDIGWFWSAVLADLRIAFYEPYERIVDLSEGPAFPKWCVGGKLNIIHNCLDWWRDTDTWHRPALIYEAEEGTVRTLTYAELYREVCRCAAALRGLGLGRGDAVGLFMPMTPELVVAFLAVIKIGGIVLPLFSGYGPEAVATRLNDAGAKALFTSDGFFRRGQAVPMKAVADEALREVPGVRHVIVHRRAGLDAVPWTEGRDRWWDEVMADQPDESPTERTGAEDVLMIIYTSGTTGRPKGAVHTHCGFPVKAAQDMYHCMDLKPGEVMWWMSDMGWMMGPWLVFGTLLIGATMVLYDGAPDHPDVDRVWAIAARHGVTHLGLSPVLVRALKPHGTEPIRRHDLSKLRAAGSTGSPWDPESWRWLFDNVLEGRKPILNYSGGTEISGGIVCGNFFKPLKPCAFSGPVPGMDADVVDEQGRPVRGAVGELIIRQPWIGMTRGFWKDPERYLDTYWRRFENVWVHGDFAAIDEDGLWYILGRSDDTIKVAGKRLGPAEVEAIVNAHEAVAESAAIGVPDPVKGEAVAVFVVLKPGFAPDEALRQALSDRIAEALGKPLRPRAVLFTRALPKTRNAKVMRRVVRAAYLDQDPGDVSSLEDPTTVDAIREAI